MGKKHARAEHWFMVVAALAVAGCAGRVNPSPPPGPSCIAGDSALVREVLYFGRNRPDGGNVTDQEWSTFVGEVLTPRFPAGLTIVSGTGQWQDKRGVIEQERSEIVTVFHAGDRAARRAVAEVAAEYKRRFSQEAVLRERTPACVRLE